MPALRTATCNRPEGKRWTTSPPEELEAARTALAELPPDVPFSRLVKEAHEAGLLDDEWLAAN